MGWALILGGGTAMGAVQVEPVRRLVERLGWPSVIVGTSVGAVNTSLLGARRMDDLRSVWDEVDGAGFFQAPQIDVWNGLFSMGPLRRQLARHDACTGLKIDSYVGIVDCATQRHRLVHLNVQAVEDARDAIIASATQPMIHERAQVLGRWCVDGGVQHVIPPLPRGVQVNEVHAISCSPVTRRSRRKPREQSDVDRLWEQGEVAFEALMTRVVRDDVKRLQQLARRVPVTLYAPQDWQMVGRPFDASRETIKRRLDSVGPWMYDHRSILGR